MWYSRSVGQYTANRNELTTDSCYDTDVPQTHYDKRPDANNYTTE